MNDGWKTLVLGAGLMLVGMIAGAQLFGAPPLGPGSAIAQTTGYRLCFLARQEVVHVNSSGDIDSVSPAHTIHIPSGYEVVGGGGADTDGRGYILICR
jgi:hypothetical protein